MSAISERLVRLCAAAMSTRLLPASARSGLVPGLLLLAGCGGDNLYQGPSGITWDRGRPAVQITEPTNGQRIAVGDSVFVGVDVADDAGVASVLLSGFSVRGNPDLGTDVQVPRFEPRLVSLEDLPEAIRDTTLTRFLLATGDTLPEDTVYIVANVTDLVGNERADTMLISIGGPRVRIVAPGTGTEVRTGSLLSVRISASDPAGLKSLSVALSGAADADSLLSFDQPVTSIDTLVALTVPAGGSSGEVRLAATARNTVNESTISQQIRLRLVPAEGDDEAPTVRFRMVIPDRVEVSDVVSVVVVGADETRLDRIGVTVAASHRLSTATEPLGTAFLYEGTDSATFRIALDELGLGTPTDTSTVRLEVTAFALDTAENCAAATVPETALSSPCDPNGDPIVTTSAGARRDVKLVRGSTASPDVASDRYADLVADEAGSRVFVSNFTRNRVEVLPFGGSSFSDSVRVGSEPWGLTISADGQTLYAANSAGTNISAVPLASLREPEAMRISPADIQLFGLEYDVKTDSVGTVTVHDYSDRPQFVGEISSGQLIYSTKPTSAREPGTIRIIDPSKDQARELNRGSEIFVGYAAPAEGRGIIVNARFAGATVDKMLRVCPRRLRSGQLDPDCITGTVTQVSQALVELAAADRTDTRIDLGRDISSIALTDTTFVAVSRDHSTIAFGEGAADPGRVFLFEDVDGELHGSSTETADLVGNAADRVVSLALNGDGSLGVARGQRSYFFDDDLRLAGQVKTGEGAIAGGAALHPLGVNYPSGQDDRRRAFVPGVDADGSPYIDIVDTFSFRSLGRVYIRDRIVGPLIAAGVGSADPDAGTFVVRLFGITEVGVVQVGLSAADLR